MFTVIVNDITLQSKPIEYDYPFSVDITYNLNEFIDTLYVLNANGHSETIVYTIFYHSEKFYKTRVNVDSVGEDYFGQLDRVFRETYGKNKGHVEKFSGMLSKMIQEYNQHKKNDSDTLSNNLEIKQVKMKQNSKKNKLPFIIGGVAIVICLVVFLFIKNDGLSLFNQSKTDQATVETSQVIATELDKLLANEQYNEALLKYPDKEKEIEWFIYQKGDIEGLTKFILQHDSMSYQFDLAFLKKDYKKVITFTDIDFTDERKRMLAISYLETDQFMEAAYINSVLNHAELTEKIKTKATEYIKTYLARKDFDGAKKMNAWTQVHQDELILKAQKINVLLTHYQDVIQSDSSSEEVKQQATKDKQLWEKEWQKIIQK